MELTVSKRSLSIFAVVILTGIGLFSLANRFGLFDVNLSSLDPRTWFTTGEVSAEQTPALKAVETALSPADDQAQWEASICSNMTEQGCTIFKSIYAKPLWEMPREGAAVSFVEVVDELEDGSQVWHLDAAKPDGTASPVYIHTARNEEGERLLIRILFDQETRKYEQK
jgi:hypothetical protein